MPYSHFDPAARVASESVLLSVTSDDANLAMTGRLCRYPPAGVAWVWVIAHVDGRTYGYVADDVPCGRHELDTKADDLAYTAADPDLGAFARQGPRASPSTATMTAHVAAHEGPELPSGPGPLELSVSATFVPEHGASGTLPGRTESLGRVTATVTLDGREVEIRGRGQWHEQHQHAPRFRQPFRYASLRGERTALVALGGPWGSSGFVSSRSRGPRTAASVTFGGTPGIEIDLGDEHLSLGVDVVYAYTIPLYGRRWKGHHVTATLTDERLSGFLNVWDP